MAKRKGQFRKQQIVTIGHSNKFQRRMKALSDKIIRVGALDKAKEAN